MHAGRVSAARRPRHRFYVSPAAVHGDTIVVEGDVVHHILHVLRLRPSDAIAIFDGTGREYVGRIAGVTRRIVTIAVERVEEPSAPFGATVTLVQAIPRHGRLETIIEKATELGVARIIPIETARTVPTVRDRRERATARQQRWQRIAIEAAQQSGRLTVPPVEPVQSLADALGECRDAQLSLIATLHRAAQPLREILESVPLVSSVAVLVGPEGDFTAEEVEAAITAGCRAVSLGHRVLRSDTAAIVLLAMTNYALNC